VALVRERNISTERPQLVSEASANFCWQRLQILWNEHNQIVECTQRTYDAVRWCASPVKVIKQTPWSESGSELYQSSDRRLSAKLVQTFEDRGCHMVSVTDPWGRILSFLDRNRYFFFQVAPQLYSRGWVGPVPDPLLLRKSCSAANEPGSLVL
jgi:hypothetical protein